MKRLLELLLTGCFHEGEIERRTIIYDSTRKYELDGKQVPCGEKYTLRCKKCGEMKTYHSYSGHLTNWYKTPCITDQFTLYYDC